MKTKSIVLLAAILVLSTQSCNKFLEEELVSDVAGNYYTTAAGLEDAVDATYSYLKYVYSNERAYTLTVFGTDTYTNGADGNYKSFNYYDNGLRSDVDILDQVWRTLYRGINQANAVLGRSANITDMDQTTLTTRLAEVRFLRALYYFYLVRQWGDVHLTLEETIGAEITANKTPEADIYEQAIVPDLEFAIANLPASQSDYGRATKPAAQHLLGLVLLTRGYKSFAESNDFSKAEEYFTNVIEDYDFKLTDDIGQLWDQDNQRNSEIIFAVQYSKDAILNGGEGNRGHLYFLMEYDKLPGMIRDIENGRPFKRFRLTDYMYNLWAEDRDIDNRYDLTYKHVWYCNNPLSIPSWTAANVTAGAKNADGSPAVEGEPRFTVGDTAIYIPGPGKDAIWTAQKKLETRYTVYTKDQFNEKIFAHIKKFMDPQRPAIQWEQGSRDWFLMRLGDTYLLRAEARFKQDNKPGAADDINVIRVRAAFPGKETDMMITDPNEVDIDLILDERAKELDAEQCRWYDLTRTGTLVQRTSLNPDVTGVEEYHIHRPIPQTQIDRTLGGYEQNCGYPGGPNCN